MADQKNFKKITSELRESLGWMDLVLSNISEGILVVKKDLTITFANDVIADIIGIPRITLLGKHIWEVLHLATEGKPIGQNDYQKAIDQKDLTLLSGRYHLQGEQEINADITASYISKINQAAFIIRDVTQQVQTEQKLAQKQRSYQEQLRSLVTELSKAEEQERQRLATELHDNLGQILAIGKMKIDEVARNQDQVTPGIDKLRDLIENAITYTRKLMSDLKPPPTLKDESLVTSIQWVTEKMKEHGLEVTIENDNQPKPLNNEVQTTLLQVVRELLFNALKHARVANAHIEITRENENVIVSVADDGVGFDTDTIDSAPKKKNKFGLFNILERIDMLGGDVEIRSAIGEGTKVTLTIPLLEEKKRLMSSQDGNSASVEKNKNKSHQEVEVLLVDDHEMMREGLKSIIGKEKDIVVTGEAADGEEAVQLTKELSPDVILMDINMPKIDGIEATKRIMSDDSNTCVIGLSLHDNDNIHKEMFRAGASAYLTKNEAFETLAATIRSEAP